MRQGDWGLATGGWRSDQKGTARARVVFTPAAALQFSGDRFFTLATAYSLQPTACARGAMQ